MSTVRSPEALALAGLVLVLAGCDRLGDTASPAESAESAPPAPLVEVVEARAGTLPLEERLSGVVRASNQVSIRPEIQGVVAEVLVRSGDAVEARQPLVRLVSDVLGHQLQQAEATVQLEQAAARGARARVAELDAQLRRSRLLAADSLATALEVEVLEAQLEGAEAAAAEAEARVALARATVEERRVSVEQLVVRSPVAGRVGLRRAEAGMLVDPSTLLFEVGNLDEVVVEVPLTEEMLGYVREGQPVRIAAAALGAAPLPARLSRISPFLATGSLSTTAEIDVAEAGGRLYPGMFVTVDVLYGESEAATVLPTSAIWEDPVTGVQGVYAVASGAAPRPGDGDPTLDDQPRPLTLRPVEVLAEGRGTVGVTGVQPGEWVVTVGQHLLARQGAEAPGRVRPTTWERVLDLQSRNREELLRAFLEEQQRIARTQGAEPPTTEEFVGEAAAAEGGGADRSADGG